MGDTIHLRHFKDGYPLCWPLDHIGKFQGPYDEQAVTCADCLRYMKEST